MAAPPPFFAARPLSPRRPPRAREAPPRRSALSGAAAPLAVRRACTRSRSIGSRSPRCPGARRSAPFRPWATRGWARPRSRRPLPACAGPGRRRPRGARAASSAVRRPHAQLEMLGARRLASSIAASRLSTTIKAPLVSIDSAAMARRGSPRQLPASAAATRGIRAGASVMSRRGPWDRARPGPGDLRPATRDRLTHRR